MLNSKRTYTMAQLTTIFHVSRASIQARLNSKKLMEQLKHGNHIRRVGKTSNRKYRKYLFDDYALLIIANSFKGKISNRKSKSSNNKDSNYSNKIISKKLSNINKKLNMIINHFHITY